MNPIAVVIALSLATVSAPIADGEAWPEKLMVGKTNIYCVQEPCPWRGIRRADHKVAGPQSLLWSQPDLPELEASETDANRLSAAWAGHECLVIEGRFAGLTLQVDRIVGTCPQ